MTYNVGSNLGFRRIGDSFPRSYSLARNSGGVAERQLVEEDRVHFRHKLNIRSAAASFTSHVINYSAKLSAALPSGLHGPCAGGLA
jgi:hypothetical protein